MSMSDDLLFFLGDGIGGYKGWDEAGFEFGKKLVGSAVGAGVGMGFSGLGDFIGSDFVSKAIQGGVQSLTTGTVTSALNGVTYSRDNGWGYSYDTFRDGAIGALTGSLGSMTGSLVQGALNSGLSGFTNDLFKNGSRLSSLSGQIASQAVNYAMGGDFNINLLNLGLLDERLNSGILELHLGGDRGASMNFGTGGANFSLDNVISSVKGLETWKVNSEILLSKEEETEKYASALRTLYSEGGVNRVEYEAILAGKTNIIEDLTKSETKSVQENGIKTISLGSSASTYGKYGINVVLSHEAYRNGEDDGIEGQLLERQRAIAGHVQTTNDLIATYGQKAVGEFLTGEAALFNFAQKNNNNDLMQIVLDIYDTSADFWKISVEGGKIFANWDKTQNITLPDGTVIKVPKDTGKVSAGKLANSLFGTVGDSSEMESLFNASGAVWDGKNWVNPDGSIVEEGWRIDLTQMVDKPSAVYGQQFDSWLKGGMSGVLEDNIYGLPDGTFGYVNRNRLLYDVATTIGSMNISSAQIINALQIQAAEAMSFLQGENSFASQYQRLFSAFADHLGGSIAPGAQSMEFSDDFASANGEPYSSTIDGKSVHTGADTRGSVVGAAILAGFGGRITTQGDISQNPLLFSTTLSDTKSVVTYETGFQFGSKFISTGVWIQDRHMTDITVSEGQIVQPGDTLGKLGDVWDVGTIDAHLHMDIVTRSSSNDSKWFQNLFKPSSASNIVWKDATTHAVGTDSYDRTYWNAKDVWVKYWKTVK
jgi:hypothetical protein